MEKICYVSFDGDDENFSISFYGYQTSIFIDDTYKKHYTSSDTYKNIVYEGELNIINHKEILGLFCDFIRLLNGAAQISVEETTISQEQFCYPKCDYIIKIDNNYKVKKNIGYQNILFIINDDIL